MVEKIPSTFLNRAGLLLRPSKGGGKQVYVKTQFQGKGSNMSLLTPNSALYFVGKCVYLGMENIDFKASVIGSQISRDM